MHSCPQQQHSDSFNGISMVMVVVVSSSSFSSSRTHLRSYSHFPTPFVLFSSFIGLQFDVTSEFTIYGTLLLRWVWFSFQVSTSVAHHWCAGYSPAVLSISPCPVSNILFLYSSTAPLRSPPLQPLLSYQASTASFCKDCKSFMLHTKAACCYSLYKNHRYTFGRQAMQVQCSYLVIRKMPVRAINQTK